MMIKKSCELHATGHVYRDNMRTLDVTLDVMRVLDVRQLMVETRMVEMRMLDAREFITNLGMLTKGVDGCKDISSRMTIIGNENWLKYGLCRCGLLETVIDNKIWLKYA